MPRPIQEALILQSAVLLFGFTGLFGRWILADASWIALGRSASAWVFLGFWFLLRAERPFVPRRGECIALACAGGLLALHWSAFFRAVQVSGVEITLLAYSTAPVFALLLHCFVPQAGATGEEPKQSLAKRLIQRNRPAKLPQRRLFGATACTCGGVALLSLLAHPVEQNVFPGAEEIFVRAGLLWGVIAALSFALIAHILAPLARRHGAAQVVWYEYGCATVALAPALPWLTAPQDWSGWLLTLFLGLVCTAWAQSLYIRALRGLPAAIVVTSAMMEPVYGIGLAWFLLGERLSLGAGFAAMFVFCGAFWASGMGELGGILKPRARSS